MIHYCLVLMGLPEKCFDEPMPPGGLRELIDQTAARFDDSHS